MKTLTANNLAAIQAQRIVQRDFLSLTVRDTGTNNPFTFNFWSDAGDKTCDVYNPETGSTEQRTFKGAGNLIEISPIAHTADLSVQDVTITLSALTTDVNSSFRTYNARQGKVELWRGWMDPDTRVMVDAAEPHFFGTIDSIEVVTGDDGNPSYVQARCTPLTQQLIRFNTETRSDASQRVRNSGDAFYLDCGTVAEWELFWGSKSSKVSDQSQTNWTKEQFLQKLGLK